MENIKEYVARKKQELKEEIENNNYKIKSVVVQVGDNPASNAYIKNKLKSCAEVGIECELIKLVEETTEKELLTLINTLNLDPTITGFIVQLPLPKHISEVKITEAIDYKKDIDGFTKRSLLNPATPQGVLTYLEDNNFKFEDANAVVIGRSNIVGRPMAKLLLDKSCNVTVIHSKTSDYMKKQYLRHADLVVVATGHRNTLTNADFIWNDYDVNGSYYQMENESCFIIDVGMNRTAENKLCGDCEGVTVCEKTPVPGGVGQLTVYALLANIVKLYKLTKIQCYNAVI